MNFPVNEQVLRKDLHEAIDRESVINVIILLMLIRVVQVIAWLRPGERELSSSDRPKAIAAENVTITLDDGTEIPVHRHQLTAEQRDQLRPGIQAQLEPDPILSRGHLHLETDPNLSAESSDWLHQLARQTYHARETVFELHVRQIIEEISAYRQEIMHGRLDQLRPQILAWAETPGQEMCLLTIETNGDLDSTIIEQRPRDVAWRLDFPEISMTHLRLLDEGQGDPRQVADLRRGHEAAFPGLDQMVPGEDAWSGLGPSMLSQDRNLALEFDIAASTTETPEVVTSPIKGNLNATAYGYSYRNLAFCVTDRGEIQVLHRTGDRSLRISVYEGGREEEMVIPKICAEYMVFLVEQDDQNSGRSRYQNSGYCTPHRAPMTGRGSLHSGAFPQSYGEV